MAENKEASNFFESYYLSNFKKYTRKIYRFGNVVLPQPINAKVFIIFLAVFFALLFFRFIPYLNITVLWIPDMIYFGLIPALVAYLLAEFREEDRMFYHYFRSYINYLRRQRKHEAYQKGQIIQMNKMKKKS